MIRMIVWSIILFTVLCSSVYATTVSGYTYKETNIPEYIPITYETLSFEIEQIVYNGQHIPNTVSASISQGGNVIRSVPMILGNDAETWSVTIDLEGLDTQNDFLVVVVGSLGSGNKGIVLQKAVALKEPIKLALVSEVFYVNENSTSLLIQGSVVSSNFYEVITVNYKLQDTHGSFTLQPSSSYPINFSYSIPIPSGINDGNYEMALEAIGEDPELKSDIKNVVFTKDTSAPTIEVTGLPQDFTLGPVTVNITITDIGSGPLKVCRRDTRDCMETDEIGYAEFAITNSGKITLTGYDKAGNTTDYVITTDKVVQKFIVSPSKLELIENQGSLQLIATVDGVAVIPEIVSVDPSIVRVDSNGSVFGQSVGTTEISIRYGNIAISVQAIVSESLPATLAIVTGENQEITLGSGIKLKTITTYNNGYTVFDVEGVVYSTTSESPVSIDSDGVIQGNSLGAALIKATLTRSDGVVIEAKPVTVYVVERYLKELFADDLMIVTLEKGESRKIQVSGKFSDNSIEDITQALTWTISDPDLLSMDDNETITAINPGYVLLEGESAGIVYPILVVIEDNTSITSISIVTDSTVNVGQTFYVSVNAAYSDGSTKDITERALIQTSNNSIITQEGLTKFSGRAVGIGNIRASFNNIETEAEISVVNGISGIQIFPDQQTINVDQFFSLRVMGVYTDGSTRDITDEVTWTVPAELIIDNTSISTLPMFKTKSITGTAAIIASYGSFQTDTLLTIKNSEPGGNTEVDESTEEGSIIEHTSSAPAICVTIWDYN